MYRKIHSQYSGKCAKCGNTYSRGDLIYWEKGNRGVFHSLCFGTKTAEQRVSETKVTASPASEQPEASGETYVLNIAELKSLALDVMDDKQGSLSSNHFAYAQTLLKKVDSWAGFTEIQLREWLKSGYKAAAFKNMKTESPPIRKRRRMIFADEGELQIDLALSGFDNPYLSWTKRESAPGLSVDIQLGFRGQVPASVIEEYETWLARILYTLETNGFDLDVNVFSIATGYLGDGKEGKIIVNVKREGKVSDFSRWSVMFSPAGFRGLIFAARLLHASKLGKKRGGVGGSRVNNWDVTFDPEKRKLTIYCHAQAMYFPHEEMDLKVRAFLKKYH